MVSWAVRVPGLIGLAMITEGFSAIYPPLGWIFAGIVLAGFALATAYLRGSR